MALPSHEYGCGCEVRLTGRAEPARAFYSVFPLCPERHLFFRCQNVPEVEVVSLCARHASERDT